MSHPLNLFQRLTRRWDAVHPYNAAQVLRVRGRLDPSAAADAWAESLGALGLGRVRVDANLRFDHQLLNGELSHYPPRELPPEASLEAHLTRELNRPFDDPQEPPFRPFLLATDAGDTCFGVVYQHWIADSVSIRLLLHEWFARMFDSPRPRVRQARGRQPRGAGEGYWRLFAARGNWRLDETVLAAFRSHMRYRRVRKIRGVGREDYPVNVLLREAPPGLIEPLKAYAHAEGVRLHDVLLSAVAETCERHVPFQPRRNRPDLSVGSIVDLRRHAAADLSDAFGLFLGFTHVVCRPRDLSDWRRLLRAVAAQNQAHRRNGIAQASMAWMFAALAINPLVPDPNLYRFYRKELPMAGGLSNVTLHDAWPARHHPDPLREYLRVSPTGPLVPLVFSTTTLGQRLFIAMTHRQSLLAPHAAQAMLDQFIARLRACARAPATMAVSSPAPPPPAARDKARQSATVSGV